MMKVSRASVFSLELFYFVLVQEITELMNQIQMSLIELELEFYSDLKQVYYLKIKD